MKPCSTFPKPETLASGGYVNQNINLTLSFSLLQPQPFFYTSLFLAYYHTAGFIYIQREPINPQTFISLTKLFSKTNEHCNRTSMDKKTMKSSAKFTMSTLPTIYLDRSSTSKTAIAPNLILGEYLNRQLSSPKPRHTP